MSTEAVITADFKTIPYEHQLDELEVSMESEARALLWTMRTGKTKVMIDTACHLYREGKIDAVLIFAPNGVHENWLVRELPIHAWESISHSPLVWLTRVASKTKSGRSGPEQVKHKIWWTKAEGQLKQRDRLAWFAFNSESMIREDVRKLVARIVRRLRTFVIFDESHDFRKPGSKRTKMARALSKRCPYRRILSGTSTTNSPLHAFSQFELLQPGALGFTTFGDFKSHFAEYVQKKNKRGQKYDVLDRYKNLDELSKAIGVWSSVVNREDCGDLPELVRSRVPIVLSPEQVKVYRELHEQYIVDVGGERVDIGEMASRINKLQQVVSGFVIDEYGELHHIPGENNRLDAVSREVYLTPGKVIIWCNFREDMRLVVDRLRKDGHEIVEYHGGTSSSEKARVRKLFAPDAENDVKALVGHPKSGGQGLNLSAAGKIIWYSHTFDAIIRQQADERATEVGGRNIPVVDLVAPGVDEYIIKNVLKKVSISEALMQIDTAESLRI